MNNTSWLERMRLYERVLDRIKSKRISVKDFIYLVGALSRDQIENDLRALGLEHLEQINNRQLRNLISKALAGKTLEPSVNFHDFKYVGNYSLGIESTGISRNLLQALHRDTPRPIAQLPSTEMALQLLLIDSSEKLLSPSKMKGLGPYPYQSQAVRRFLYDLRGTGIIADEVGLGKTIEAGMIIQEYIMRAMISSCLILVPATLVSHWETKLLEHFDFPLKIPKSLSEASESPNLLVSLDRAKLSLAEVLRARHWDLVVVDECHTLKNQETRNFKFVYSLSKKYCLLLSATPIQNELRDLYNLVTICKPGMLESWRRFRKKYVLNRRRVIQTPRLRRLLQTALHRTRREDTGLRWMRRNVDDIPVQITSEEKAYHDAVYNYVRFLHEKYVRGSLMVGNQPQQGVPQLEMLLILILKELASSKSAVIKTLSQALRKQVATLVKQTDDKSDLLALDRTIALVRTCKSQTKLRTLMDNLDKYRGQGKIIIFTEFLGTQSDVADQLKKRKIDHVIYNGQLSIKEKRVAEERFREAGCDVMVSTETGGQGLDLQFANVVVNFDFPWNPMRLEQRIGRVDRLNQHRPIWVYNIYAPGTIEAYILDVLSTKLDLAHKVIGEIGTILSFLREDNDVEANIGKILLDSKDFAEMTKRFEQLAKMLLEGAKQHQTGQSKSQQYLDQLL